MPVDKQIFAARLRELMAERGTTAEELAQAVDVGELAVNRWLAATDTPKWHILFRIGDFFGVSLADLLGHDKEVF